jgi:hypothetical protein
MALMGRNASVQLDSGTNTVADLYNWKIDLASNPITQAVFGDVWSKTHGLGINAWSGSFDGIYSKDDTLGQVALQNAQIAGTMVSGVRFYMDADTTYYSGDLYITSQGLTADPEDVVRVTYSFQGTGVLALT